MKRFFLLVVCVVGFLASFSQEKIPVTLTVQKISAKGNIYIAVYHTAESFLLEEKTFMHKIVENVNSTSIEVNLGFLAPGKYAVAVFLDKNKNGQLDKNFLGIPNEPYGFTGTNLPKMRAPYFSESAIDIHPQQKKLIVSLK